MLNLQHLPTVCCYSGNLYTGGLRKWDSNLDILCIFLRQLKKRKTQKAWKYMCFCKIKSISLGQVFSAEIKHLKIECEKEINWQIFWMKKKKRGKVQIQRPSFRFNIFQRKSATQNGIWERDNLLAIMNIREKKEKAAYWDSDWHLYDLVALQYLDVVGLLELRDLLRSGVEDLDLSRWESITRHCCHCVL